MMKLNMMARIGLVVAMLPLASCQSLFHSAKVENTRIGPSGIWVPKERDPAEYAASQLALGRDSLNYEQYGLAIISFRNAQRFPETAAAAHNGLAVAFAQIGRADLAERFFKLAMEEAPGDRSYAENLTNFYAKTPALAVRTLRELPGVHDPAIVLAASQSARLERIAANQVTLRLPATSTLAERGRVAAGRRINPAFAARSSYPIRPSYPIRIEFSGTAPIMRALPGGVAIATTLSDQPRAAATLRQRDPSTSAAPAARKSQYPIRLVL